MILTKKFGDLSDPERRLIVSARDTSMNAYAPYSGFAVGAAVQTKSGQVFTGANLENAAYGHKFTDPTDASQVVTPCGRCRQLIFEASQIAGTDVRVFSCSGDLEQIREAVIADLLPEAFGPKNLGLENIWPDMRAKLIRRVTELEEGFC
jgi:cytidine deaminase